MSKSRKRRTRRTSQSRSSHADLARDPHLRHMLRVNDVEQRGDAWRALQLIQEMPTEADGRAFWRPTRIDRLLQLATFGPSLPGWARSRWLVELSLQDLDLTRRRQHHQALELAIEVRGGEEAVEHPSGEDPRITVQDHDWVFRQLKTYDHGGLASYLRRRAHPDIVTGADRIEDWVTAPMGGFGLVGSDSATTTWCDLATGEGVVTANIGSAALVLPGEHVIGRMVPIENGRLFETAPLLVPRAVATEVAEEPSRWLGALRRSRDDGSPVNPTTRFGFLSDVPRLASLLSVYDVDPLDVDGTDLAPRLLTTVRRALDGEFADDGGVHIWPCLAREVMSHDVLVGLADLPAEEVEVLAELGEVLADPAASICRAIVAERSHAA